MDLERIKQNLRLRSGRSQKPPKKSRAQKPVTIEQNARPATNGASTPAQSVNRTHTPSQAGSNTAPPQSARPHLVEPGHTGQNFLKKVDSGIGSSQAGSEKGRTISENAARSPVTHTDNEASDLVIEEHSKSEDSQLTERETTSQATSNPAPDPYVIDGTSGSDADDFDLRPPAPKPKAPSLESLSELLFSAGHLSTLIHQPELLAKFTAFLQRYRPGDYPLLMRYLETSKAITAVEYANALAKTAPDLPRDIQGNQVETSNVAAVLDRSFYEACSAAFNTLVHTSLPLYITYSFVRVLSELLTDEITGRSSPLLRDMVGGLSEVFCLTDPNQEDNPIIYASEEFYRLTAYGQEDVIGHNCRFLQGAKTNPGSRKRLRAGLDSGEEVCETLLNYRRDGKPFMNVLMIAPLHDNKGQLKYHIGAQVDVSGLVQGRRVLGSFQRYLTKRESDERRRAKETARSMGSESIKKKEALDKLRELSEFFDLEESAVIQSHSRAPSVERDDDAKSVGSGNARRRIIDSDASDDDEEGARATDEDWKLGQAGPQGMSGKLPGIYQTYMLVRPAPSLRIVFVSPKLRKFGNVVQSPFLSHVAAPSGTLSGLEESFKGGIPVTARINFTPRRTEQRYGTKIPSSEKHEDGKHGRACWISATPLLGSDDRVGVWMIVFVEKAQARARAAASSTAQSILLQNQQANRLEGVDKPKLVDIPKATNSSRQTPETRLPGPPGTNQKAEGSEKTYNLPIKPKRLDDPIHAPVQRQASVHSTAAYQYQAADPVEEYHSMSEEAESPVHPAPRADMPPHTPEYEIASDDEYVQPVSHDQPERSQDRLRITLDNDEPERDIARDSLSFTDFYPAPDRPVSPEAQEDGHGVMNPNEIAPSTPSDAERSSGPDSPEVDAKTPTRPSAMPKGSDYGVSSEKTVRHRSTPQSPPSNTSPAPGSTGASSPSGNSKGRKANSARNTGTLPAGLGYLDYLRHPGSSRQASGEVERGRRKSRPGLESDRWNDSECATSPYSVD